MLIITCGDLYLSSAKEFLKSDVHTVLKLHAKYLACFVISENLQLIEDFAMSIPLIGTLDIVGINKFPLFSEVTSVITMIEGIN